MYLCFAFVGVNRFRPPLHDISAAVVLGALSAQPQLGLWANWLRNCCHSAAYSGKSGSFAETVKFNSTLFSSGDLVNGMNQRIILNVGWICRIVQDDRTIFYCIVYEHAQCFAAQNSSGRIVGAAKVNYISFFPGQLRLKIIFSRALKLFK